MSHDEMIERIYEAAAVPELWSGRGVLDRLAVFGDCTDAVLLAVGDRGLNGWATNAACAPKMEVYVRENWVALNPYLETAERRARFDEPRFLLDTEVMSAEEMGRNRYYQDFMRPHGIYWHAGTSIGGPSGDIIKLSVLRSYEAGPLDPAVAHRLTALRPHLARAALLTARLRFEQVRAAIDAFDIVGLPTAAVRRGRLVMANKGFEPLLPAVAQDRQARLTFVQEAADACWRALVEAAAPGGTFPIAAAAGQPTMIVHVLPIVGAGRDIFSVADMLLVIVPARDPTAPDARILSGLFDLTAAEAAVARDLAAGRTLGAIATARGVSAATVRSQLKAIFAKTGTHRQIDLVRILTGPQSLTAG